MPPRVELVLCRHMESVEWALRISSTVQSVGLAVYNNGPPLEGVPIGIERQISNVGREAFCFLEHMVRLRRTAKTCGAACVSPIILFSQANPSCSKVGDLAVQYGAAARTRAGTAQQTMCEVHFEQQVRLLASGQVTLEPRGFVDLDPSRKEPARLTTSVKAECWQSTLLRISDGVGGFFFDGNGGGTKSGGGVGARAQPLYYSPGSQFAVSRENLLESPRGWIDRAHAELQRSRPLPWVDCMSRRRRGTDLRRARACTSSEQAVRCCDAAKNHTCLPWLLERFWAALLDREQDAGSTVPSGEPSPLGGGLERAAAGFEADRALSKPARAEIRSEIGSAAAHGARSDVARAAERRRLESRLWAARWSAAASFTDAMTANQHAALTAVLALGEPRAGAVLQRAASECDAHERNRSAFEALPSASRQRWREDAPFRRAAHELCFALVQNATLLRATLPRFELSPASEPLATPPAAAAETLPVTPRSQLCNALSSFFARCLWEEFSRRGKSGAWTGAILHAMRAQDPSSGGGRAAPCQRLRAADPGNPWFFASVSPPPPCVGARRGALAMPSAANWLALRARPGAEARHGDGATSPDVTTARGAPSDGPVSPRGFIVHARHVGLPRAPPDSEGAFVPSQPCPTFRDATLCGIEADPWRLVRALVTPEDTVIEYGARYGTTSCALAAATNNSGRVVSVEPDPAVADALLSNLASHRCNAHAVLGSVGDEPLVLRTDKPTNGYDLGSRSARAGEQTRVAHFTLRAIERRIGRRFDAAIIDCEGCVDDVLGQRGLLAQLRLVIIEEDAPERTNYSAWHARLDRAGFEMVWRSRDTFRYPGGWKPVWSRRLFYTAWRRRSRPPGGGGARRTRVPRLCAAYAAAEGLSRRQLDCHES